MVPPTPETASQDDARSRIVNFRVFQIGLSILTVGFTVWLWVIHPIAGIVATFITKHILVAILACGLEVPSAKPNDSPGI